MACRVGGVAGFGSRGSRLPAGSELGQKGPGFDCRTLLDFFAFGQLYTDWDTRFEERRVYTYLDGPGEQLTNGSFDAWTAGKPDDWQEDGGALASQVAAVAGFSVPYACRITIPVADNSGSIRQAVTPGARYRATARLRGDGVNGVPHLWCGGSVWAGTSSASVQVAEVEFTAAGGFFNVLVSGNVATEDWIEADDVTLEELPRTEVLNHPTLAARMLADPAVLDRCDALCAALASCPVWDDEEQALGFFGGEYLTADALAAKYVPEDSPLGMLAVSQCDTVVNNKFLWHVASSTSNQPRRAMRVQPALEWRLQKYDNTGAGPDADSGIPVGTNRQVLACRDSGTELWFWQDGAATSISATAANVGAHALDYFTLGAYRTTTVGGQMGAYIWRMAAAGDASNETFVQASRWLMSAHGV